MFHSLSGCDTVSSFDGRDTDAILTVSSAPSEMEEDVMHTIERFVILLYDRTSKSTDINKARKTTTCKEDRSETDPTN